MKLQNIFESIPINTDAELFTTLLETSDLKIERIVSRGHTSPESGWHDQDQNEWIIVLKGEAVISFENDKEINLGEGSYLNIPAHKKHRVNWTTPYAPTIWLAVHY